MPLRLYNTLGRQLQEFVPLRTDGRVGLYTCGPTVYAEAHLGNLRTYIFEDVLRRTLAANGYTVEHVMNITDVGHLVGDEDQGEDKVEKAASAKGMDAWQLATHFTQIFQADLAALNVLPPQKWIKATDTIQQQIALVQQLEAKGFTYATSDGIYFDTSKLPSYGMLEPQRLAGQRAGERVDMGEKKNPTDFALWKLSHPTPRHPELVSESSQPTKKRQMEWPSPWGVGFPGWHLECSAICQDAFANFTPADQAWLDIHCGGIDHVAVHHTNEIAQTQAATDRPLAKFWLHGAFLIIQNIKTDNEGRVHIRCSQCGKEFYTGAKISGGVVFNNVGFGCTHCGFINVTKMAKSGENFITLEFLTNKGMDSLAYRYFTLQAHYRSALTFSWEAVEAAQSGWHGLRAKALALPSGPVDDAAFQQFMDAVNDDLNTAKALATLHGYVSQAGATRETVAKMDGVLGLQLLDAPVSVEAPAEIRALADLREAARQTRDFARADELRKQIEAAGWTVEDTPTGPALKPR